MTRPLSKSKLIAYRQCPKRLWLEIHRPELREDGAATQAVFAAGHKVGALAQSIFDPAGAGYLVDMQALGVEGTIAKTQSLVSALVPQPIFEAGFKSDASEDGGALAFADVLLPTSSGSARLDTAWHMIEVKSSTKVKDYYREDAAIQYYVAKNAGVNLASISLAVVDTSWVYRGDGDYKGLLKLEDVTESSAAQDAYVRGWIADAQGIAKLPAAPAQATGAHCDAPFHCGFYAHCAREDGTAALNTLHPISWLPRISSAKINQLFGADADVRALSMMDVPDASLNAVQRRIKLAHTTGNPFVDMASLGRELAPHEPMKGKPAYFLDFETVMQAVPIWAGTRPYQTILYQFSCHVVRSGGEMAHHEFLDTSGADPRAALAEALIDALGERHGGMKGVSAGTIFMYSPYERTQLKNLGEAVPKHRAAIERIISRLVDLHPIVRYNYYHSAQEGSWSIKNLLPAMFGNDDAELSYAQLGAAGKVADGGAAQAAYLEAIEPDTTPERKAQIHVELLAYCKLDTLAMVRWCECGSG